MSLDVQKYKIINTDDGNTANYTRYNRIFIFGKENQILQLILHLFLFVFEDPAYFVFQHEC